jgi:pantetheine-phosphate adenylyltransferase
MPKRAIYPGSFDVLTHGHLDIIRRGASVCDHLVVGVADNLRKTPIFTRQERLDMLRRATTEWSNVSAEEYDGLTVDFATEHNASIILRGLRFVSDFESELQIAMANSRLAEGIETLFLAPSAEFSYISSSMVKQMAWYGRNVDAFVPPFVGEALLKRFAEQKENPSSDPVQFN